MNIETTYDVVVLAEAGMYLMVALMALAGTVYGLCAAWHKAAEAQAQVQYNRIEWEQQRQQAQRLDDDLSGLDVHEDTAEFYRLDDE